jgi:hypothetical protein
MPELELVDLALNYSEKLLKNFYYEVYLPAFPIKDEREDFEAWQRSLICPAPEGPATHIIIGGYNLQTSQPVIAGGQAVEYYVKSNAGLMTYLVIAEPFRGKGLAKIFTKAGISALNASALPWTDGQKPFAYFSETNDPNNLESFNDTQNPLQRIILLSKLGFYLVHFPYVQPRLEGRSKRYYGLKLIVHELSFQSQSGPAQDQDSQAKLKAGIIESFLKEFYKSCEGKIPPKSDPDWMKMSKFIRTHPWINCSPLTSIKKS